MSVNWNWNSKFGELTLKQELNGEVQDLMCYDDAIKYLESKGVGCDPCQDVEGEYVCDLLDDEYDKCDEWDETWYYKRTLDKIAKMAKEYKED